MPQADLIARVDTLYDDYGLTSREVYLAFDHNRYAVVDEVGNMTGEYFPLCESVQRGLPGSGIRRVIMRKTGIMMHWPPRRRIVMGVEQEQDNGDGSWKAVK